MIFHNVQQNSPEWEALRRGKFTASIFDELFLSKSTVTYEKAIAKVVYERLTGESPESFQSDYMKRGHELESAAHDRYNELKFVETLSVIEPGGFFELDEFTGASPDGLIEDDGIVEIKCPAYNTMIKYLIDKKLPNQYKYQVQGQLYVTGRSWCDFFAYSPKLKPHIIRIYPDGNIIDMIKYELDIAIKKANDLINKLK